MSAEPRVSEPASGAAIAPDAATDTGLVCLVMMARFHAIAADADQLAHEFRPAGAAFSTVELLLAAKHLQLTARCVRATFKRLATTPVPAIALNRDGRFFILAGVSPVRTQGTDGAVSDFQVLIHDPARERPERLSGAEFQARWSGELILITSRASRAGDLGRFDFTWFVPAVVKYRRLLLEVLLVSATLQMFALVTPLFFQVVMDKVLVHRGFSTLDVIAAGLLIVTLFEVTLTALRARLQEKFNRGAENQAFLVETISGIHTVKAADSSA